MECEADVGQLWYEQRLGKRRTGASKYLRTLCCPRSSSRPFRLWQCVSSSNPHLPALNLYFLSVIFF